MVPTGKNPKAKQCDGLVAKLDGVFFCFDYVLNMCVSSIWGQRIKQFDILDCLFVFLWGFFLFFFICKSVVMLL